MSTDRPIEDRLAQALVQTARRSVPDHEVPPSLEVPASVHALSMRSKRYLPLLAAAAVVLAVFGVTLAVNATHHNGVPGPGNSTSISPSPTSSTATSTPSPTPTLPIIDPTGRLLQRGQVGDRADVPWNMIDRGWVLAVWSNGVSGANRELFLVDPEGGRYDLGASPDGTGTIEDWSSTGRYALVDGSSGSYDELDLTNGHLTLNAYPQGSILGYLPAPGHEVLGETRDSNSLVSGVGVINANDTITRPFPNSAPGTSLLDYSGPSLIQVSNDVFAVGVEQGIVFLSSSGSVVRVVHAPSGVHTCIVVNEGTASAVIANCASSGPYAAAAYSFGLDGVVTPMRLVLPAGYGTNQEAWQLTGADVFAVQGSCGADAVITRPGAKPELHIPLPAGALGKASLLDAYDTTILSVTDGTPPASSGPTRCRNEGPNSLVSYNIQTKAAEALLGPGMNGGDVLGVFPFH